jgi:LmbE family N-acetylglucosaminyl deacetylase
VVDNLGFPTRRMAEVRQDILQKFISLGDYDLVFIPSMNDTHQDHKTVAQEAFRAFKFSTVLSWETPWNNLSFSPNVFCAFSFREVLKKLGALERYQTQQSRFYFDPEFIKSWAKMRGTQIKQQYAEAFELVRLIS